MNDSVTNIVNVIEANWDTIFIITSAFISILIIPLIYYMKKYNLIGIEGRPEEEKVKFVLIGLLLWGITSVMSIDMGIDELVERALALVGVSSIIYNTGGSRSIKTALRNNNVIKFNTKK